MNILKTISFLMLAIIQTGHAQTPAYDRNSSDTAILKTISSVTGRFIIRQPYKTDDVFYLDTLDLMELMNTAQEYATLKNKHWFLQDNSLKMDKKSLDTTAWEDADLPGKIIAGYDDELDYRELQAKYHLQKDKKFRDTVWRYNNDECFKRALIARISKPAFNTAKTLCAVEVRDRERCHEGFTESVYLFYKTGDTWVLFEPVIRRRAVY